MKQIRTTLAAALTLSACCSFSATAQSELETLTQADLDGDGVITCQEAQTYRQQRFWAQDRNQDENLDLSEFRAALPERVNGFMARLAFSRMDTSGDGAVSAQELAAAPLVRFERADTDADCRLTQDEVEAALQMEAGR